MEFKKIDETKFQCVLYQEDLEDNHISLDDFFRNDTAKIHGLLDVVMAEAQKSIGVIMDSGIMSLQLAPQPNHSILLTISSGGQELGKMIKQAGEEAIDALSTNVPDDEIDEDASYHDMADSELEEELSDLEIMESQVAATQDKAALKSGTSANINERGLDALKNAIKESGRGDMAVFAIHTLKDLEDFCRVYPRTYGVKNALYRSTQDQTFLLVLEKGRCSETKYGILIQTLTEFGEFAFADKARIAYIKEHNEVYIKENAINTIMKYCNK